MKELTEEKIKRRQQVNREIVRTISAMVESEPNLRFGQILACLDVVVKSRENPLLWSDEFYLESVDLLERIKESSAKLGR